MENKTQSEAQQPTIASPAPKSPKAKASETRLKEMSKRTKSRLKPGEPRHTSKTQMFNPNWFYYGIGLAGILGVGYLIFRGKNQKPEYPTRAEYRFVPAKRKPPVKTEHENLPTIPEEKPAPSFELTSF